VAATDVTAAALPPIREKVAVVALPYAVIVYSPAVPPVGAIHIVAPTLMATNPCAPVSQFSVGDDPGQVHVPERSVSPLQVTVTHVSLLTCAMTG